MHTSTCWTRNGYVSCAVDEICCASGAYEACCPEASSDIGAANVYVIFFIIFGCMFLSVGILFIIRCACYHKHQQGRVTGISRRLSIHNRTHPAVHLHPHSDIEPPGGNMRGRVPGGQVFVVPPTTPPPPPYPTGPSTPGVGDSTVGYNQTRLNGVSQPVAITHTPPPYPPNGPQTHPTHRPPPYPLDGAPPYPPNEPMNRPPHGQPTQPPHGRMNVPPPFEYIPPASVLYK